MRISSALLISSALCFASAATRPHIVWVVADDLGYNDVSFTGTGSEVKTPNLQRLAADGVVLGKYYVNAICTPTRSSFMTGRYPIHLGLQHGVIEDGVPDAVPINETMIAEVMRDTGYATHMIGKWHLGFHQPRYTPERRGFDSVLGYYTGNEEYWNHTSPCWSCGNYTALDFHRANATHFEPITHLSGTYSTNAFADEAIAVIKDHAAAEDKRPLFLYLPFEAVHGASSCYREGKTPDCAYPDGDELQAPENYIAEQMAAGIADRQRATFGAMVGALDDAVGNISLTLDEVGFGGNALIVFTTDNGGPNGHFDGHGPSNFPLRAGKGSNFEGGVRGASFIAGSAVPLVARGSRSMSLMHCADWFPTFAGLAGAMLTPKQKQALDGFDMWPTITGAAMQSPRAEILHNIDPTDGRAAIRVGKYKYLISNNKGWGADPRLLSSLPAGECLYEDICPKGWEGGIDEQEGDESNGIQEYLFNVDVDPQERVNLIDSTESADVAALARVKSRLEQYRASMVPLRNLEPDEAAVPEVVPGLNICTPSPEGPILCQDIGVWRPWQPDPEDSFFPTLIV